ncbi:claudin-8 [Lonchura striata]|uniref:claudin-8 n=1 Tax=Lonchura striata TaxID=40157 RepID=UPI000B4D7FC2|nr:claudin-8 [Lonchura striata domestica]
MACCMLQITGLIFGGVGMVGTLAATAMPQWRVSAYVDGNIVVFETIWEGLWMDCISQLGIRLQCKLYDSVLALPPLLEAFRALMCLAAGLAVVAFLTAIAGVKYTRRGTHGPRAVSIFILAAGAAFLLTGTLVLIPVSWTGGSIIRDFYDPEVPVPLKRELGAALYVGWGSAALLLAAGAMYCHCWCRAGTAARHSHPRLARAGLPQAERPALGIHAYV